MTTAVLLRSGMTRKCHVPFCRAVEGVTLSLTLIRINHTALLDKANYNGKVRRQIKSWLKSGVVDQGSFTAVTDGTPQGGVISPLLANIALHGIQRVLNEYIETVPMREDKYPYRYVGKA